MAKKKLSSYQKLKKNMKALKHELNDKELELREQIIKNLNTEEIKLQNKLISKLLNAKIKNKGLMNYHELLNNDFLEFANYEESLSNEAEAIIKLQTIEKKLEIISSYPDIFTKNIIAVGGGFSAGKSEFISSFINDNEVKLPIGIEPTTAIPTYVINKDEPMILACNNQSASINLNEIDNNMYKKLSHKFINSFGFNLKQIMPYMVLGTKLKFDNICFIDTPGYNPSSSASDYTSEDLNTAKDYLKNASALIWLIGLDVNGTIPKSDLDFLDELELDNKELFIVLNKADLKTKSDIEKILANVADVLDEYGLDYSGISAYSSLQKIEIANKKQSLHNFLKRPNINSTIKDSLISELEIVENMYKTAITDNKNNKSKNKKALKDISLDLLENGFSDEKVLKKLEEMQETFDFSKQDENLKRLKTEFTKLKNAIAELFGK